MIASIAPKKISVQILGPSIHKRTTLNPPTKKIKTENRKGRRRTRESSKKLKKHAPKSVIKLDKVKD